VKTYVVVITYIYLLMYYKYNFIPSILKCFCFVLEMFFDIHPLKCVFYIEGVSEHLTVYCEYEGV